MGTIKVNENLSPPRQVNTRSSDRVLEIGLYVFAILMLIVLIYPLYFIIIASFSEPAAVANGQVWLFPKDFTLAGYQELLKHSNIWIGYKNTIIYTVVGTAIGLVVNISAAYALSRRDLVGGKYISLLFIFTMFFNGGLIPTFMTVRDFQLYDTFLVMVLPFSVAVFNIIVARTFSRTVSPTIYGRRRSLTVVAIFVTSSRSSFRYRKRLYRSSRYGRLSVIGTRFSML